MTPKMEVIMHEAREAAGLYDVPCNGCTLCCHGDAVRILPHEDPARWLTEPHEYVEGARMLAHQANGDCIYLGPTGCTQHHDKPQQCREMDCRRLAEKFTFTQARKLSARRVLPIAVWNRGRELLKGGA